MFQKIWDYWGISRKNWSRLPCEPVLIDQQEKWRLQDENRARWMDKAKRLADNAAFCSCCVCLQIRHRHPELPRRVRKSFAEADIVE